MIWVVKLIVIGFLAVIAAWPTYAFWLVEYMLSPIGDSEKVVYLFFKCLWVLLQLWHIVLWGLSSLNILIGGLD